MTPSESGAGKVLKTAKKNVMKMLKTALTAATILSGTAALSMPAFAASHASNMMVGGAPMSPEKTIVDNAVNFDDHTTLVGAVKAAGLVDTLNSDGPFTVFAPDNEAFSMLPDGTVETMLKPENKDQLTKILAAHVITGKLTAEDMIKNPKAHGGRYTLQAVSGDALTVDLVGNDVWI